MGPASRLSVNKECVGKKVGLRCYAVSTGEYERFQTQLL